MDDFKVLLQAAVDIQKSQNEVNSQIKKLKTESLKLGVEVDTKSAKKAINDISKETERVLSQDKSILNNRISSYVKNNPALNGDFRNALKNLQGEISTADKIKLNGLQKEFRVLTSEVNKLGLNGDTVFSRLQKNTMQFVNFLASGTLIMSGVNALRDMVVAVKDLDAAMTELRKVTDESESTYRKFFDTAASSAQKLGSSISDVINMTADWARAGYNLSDSAKLAEVSTVFQNVADMNVADSVSNIITPMKAFNIAASEAITVVDKLNKVDNEFSVTASDVSSGLRNSASALALAGNDLNESIALLTGGSEITQNATEMGNAIKVLSMRLRGMKGDLEAIGEEYDGILPVSKIQTQIYNLTKGTVNIMDDLDPTKFKSTYEIIEGISKVWSQISETDQAQLLEIVAGKQRGNQVAALIQSFESGQTQKALEASINSANSALDEQAKYMASIEYSADRLKGSFQELAANTLDSDWVKGFYDVSNVLVQLTDKVGLFNIALIALTGVVGAKTTLGMTALQGVIEKLIIKMGVGTAAAETMGMALSTMIPAALIIGSVTTIVKVYEWLNVTLEEHKQLLEDAKSAYAENKSELESVNKQLVETRNRMAELNAMDNLTFVEKEELDNLKQTTEQLLIQKDVLEKLNAEKQKSVIDETISTYKSQFGKKTPSQEQISSYVENSNISGNYSLLMADQNDISSMIAAYKQFTELKSKAYKNNEDVTQYNDLLEQISTSLFKNVDDLNNYKSTLESIPYESLSKEQQDYLGKINTAIELVYTNLDPNKWKDIQFQKILSKDDLKDTITSLNEIAKTEVISPSQIESSKGLMSALKEAGITANEASEQFNAMNSAQNKISESNTNLFDSSKEVEESLSSLAEEAKAATGYVNEIGKDVNIDNLQEAIESARSSVSDFNSILKDMKDNNGITSDSLEKIISKYPKLLAYVGDETKLREELQKSIKEQNKIAEDYYKSVLEMDTDLYNSVVKNNSDRVNKLSEYYGTDIGNWKSLAQAKADIEGKLLTELSKKWADYYSARETENNINNAISDENSPAKNLLGNNVYNTSGMSDMDKKLQQSLSNQTKNAKKAADEAQKNYNDLKNLFVDTDYTSGLTKAVGGVKSTPGKSKSTKTEFSQQIDWIAVSAENATEKINKLKDAINDDLPYKTQISNLKKLISGQESLIKTYKTAATSYKSQYNKSISGLSPEYIKRIQSGETFKIEDFKGESGEKLYNTLTIAQKYWGSYKDYLDKVDDTTKELTENTKKLSETTVDSKLDKFEKQKEKLSGLDDDIQNALDLVESGSNESVLLLQAGYKNASDSVANLKKEITALNKAYAGNKSDETYKTRLADLEEQLNSAASSMKSYKDQIIDAMKQSYEEQTDNLKDALDEQLDAIEKAHDSIIDSLKDQLDAYKEIIDAKKESLRTTEDEYQYQKKIAEQTNNINKINSRIAELSKAANSGDRAAAAEMKKLQDELAEAQSDLDDTQHDRKIELEEEALDKAYDDYEKLINGQIDLENKAYETQKSMAQKTYDLKLSNLNNLYTTEMDYIKQAAELTTSAFSEAFAGINQQLAQYGLSISSDLSGALFNTNSSLNTSLSSVSKTSSVSSSDPILKLLKNGTGTTGNSNLNKYIGENYGSYLTFTEMLQLAKMMGVSGINSLKDVEESGTNRNKILDALKLAKYKDGGILGDVNSTIKGMGEDALFVGSKGESVLTEPETKAYRMTGGYLAEMVNLLKPNNLNPANYSNNTNNSPSLHIDNLLTVQGNVDRGVVDDLKSSMNTLVEQVSDRVMKNMRKF